MFYCLIIALLAFLKCARSSGVPASPCPGVLEYLQDASGGLLAHISSQNDLSDSFMLSVNLAVSENDTNDFAIKLDTCEDCLRNGEDLHYYLSLKRNGIIPTITSINFNNKTVCATLSPQDPLVRNISIIHQISIAKSLVRRQVAENNPLNTTFNVYFYEVPELDSNVTSGKLELSSVLFPQKNNVSDYSLPVEPTPQIIPAIEGNIPEIFTTNNRPSNIVPTTQIPITTSTFLTSSGLLNTELVLSSTKPSTVNRFPTFQTSSIIPNTDLEVVCGRTKELPDRILYGEQTSSGEYPWLVAMFFLDVDYNFSCGGTLISDRHVLTAAHCLTTYYINEKTKDRIQIVLGRHNIHQWAFRSTLRGVTNYYIHPDYSKISGDADVAVLVLDKSVTFSDVVKPICLWKGPDELNNIVGHQGFVAGWGKDEERHEYVSIARQLSMPVVSQEACLRSDPRLVKTTSDRTFCAGNRKGGIPCTGDSGGGFVMFKDGRWYLRGVVSLSLPHAELTCDPNNYVVFADVPKYNSWLNKVLIES